MMRLASPWAFLLLLPWAFAAWRMLRRTKGNAIRFPRAALLARKTSLRQRLSVLPPFLALLGMLCGIVALARPQKVFSQVAEEKDVIAIEMALDISGSMRADDLKKNKTRLEVVKETFRDFVEKRPNDLIGLVTFGGYATTRAPLTPDHNALLHILGDLKIPGDDGEPVSQEEVQTAIGDGLAMACARLEAASNVVSRVAILLSDGVNNFGIISPEQAISIAKQQKVKIYTIGIGKPVPRIIQGFMGLAHKLPPELDEKTLRLIAKETGGIYRNITSKNALEAALSEIDELEKTTVETNFYRHYEEQTAPWLIACCLLLIFALLLAPATRRSLL